MLEKLLDEVGDYVFFIDFFNWGEPLLNPRLHEFIQLANSYNVLCTVSTNLSLPLSDERIQQLVTSGLRELIVSLDGASAGTYETYRRRGKFDLVVDNMRRIVRAKRALGLTTPLISWQFLVFGFNEHEVEKARSMAVEMGVDRILVRPAALDVDRFPLSAEDQAQMANWRPQEPLYQIETVRPSATQHHSRCGWHYTSAAINWDGTVAPCCTVYEKEHDFGTLAAGDSYMDVVNNQSFQAVRERFSGRRTNPVAEVCEHCPTPSIMDYHEFLNRQVLLFTAVALIERVRGLWGGGYRGLSRSAASAGQLPAR
jgi:MoaA/NifB/PqqE/SkfB family radical SAM enzyme